MSIFKYDPDEGFHPPNDGRLYAKPDGKVKWEDIKWLGKVIFWWVIIIYGGGLTWNAIRSTMYCCPNLG